MTDTPFRHVRDLQIMPADGWWAVYGEADGSFSRDRIVGFALSEEWFSSSLTEAEPPSGADIERLVSPLAWGDGYIDRIECENLLGIVHVDEWATQREGFERLARECAQARTAIRAKEPL